MRKTLTRDETQALEAGDHVMAEYARGWEPAVVRHPAVLAGGVCPTVWVCPVARGVNGRARPLARRWPHQLCALSDLPPATANVYADWLEDHGHPEAAAALRAAFPLGDAP